MSLLDELIVGRANEPPRMLLYGPEKIGKSTFAASAPNPVFIQTEDGLGQIGATRFPLARSLEVVLEQLNKVRTAAHDFATLCIDSLDWLEKAIWAKVCRDSQVKSIEKAAGGYGKGYTEAASIMFGLLTGHLDAIRAERGMAIILIAHSKVEKVDEPGIQTYGRSVPDVHKSMASIVSEWADVIGFAHKKVIAAEDKSNEKRFIVSGLGKDGGDRVLRMVGTPSYLAGNRYKITTDLPLFWDAFIAALDAAEPQPVPQVA
jgi:hypothetical protein